MTFNIHPSLEASLREIARDQGRDVQAIVSEALQSFAASLTKDHGGNGSHHRASDSARSLRGSVLRYDEPASPALPDSDWESAN